MREALTLNMFQPDTWAWAVSSETWAEYGLTEVGVPQWQPICEPLVVKGQTLTPQVERVKRNASPQFKYFERVGNGNYIVQYFHWKSEDVYRPIRWITMPDSALSDLFPLCSIASIHEAIRRLGKLGEQGETIYWLRRHVRNTVFYLKLLGRMTATKWLASVFIRELQSASYRAHITKRVQPVLHRARPPRPLYLRPHPPSAPTAPPVA